MLPMKEETIIFTDGASRGNPGPGGWGAIVSFTKSNSVSVKELGGRQPDTTNNRMELTAVIQALAFALAEDVQIGINSSAVILTDSSYVINGATKWLAGWQRNNWITSQKQDVLNRDLWEEMSELITGRKVRWNYIGGHSGIPGNERCDEIATSFADGNPVPLYDGPADSYTIDLENLSGDPEKKSSKSSAKNRSKAKAYSYLSYLNGKVERHLTWAECEARVKGKSGAKFKKALDPEEEKAIIAEWTAK